MPTFVHGFLSAQPKQNCNKAKFVASLTRASTWHYFVVHFLVKVLRDWEGEFRAGMRQGFVAFGLSSKSWVAFKMPIIGTLKMVMVAPLFG